MIKWLFNNKLQIVIDLKEKWDFAYDIKGEYFDAETYKKFLSFGKIILFWDLPTAEEIEKVLQENEF